VQPILFVVNLTASETNDTLLAIARNLGWAVVQLARISNSGVPYIKDMYLLAARLFPVCRFYGFANGDIVFNRGLIASLQTISLV